MCSGFISAATDTGKTVLKKPDGRRAVLRSQVLELHGISHGSAGAASIATMATPERLPDGTLACWQAHERAGPGQLSAADSLV